MESSSGLTSVATILENLACKTCGNCDHEFWDVCNNPTEGLDGKPVKPTDKACSEWRETSDLPIGGIDLTGGEF